MCSVIGFAIAALDGPAEEAAQGNSCAICGDLALAQYDLIDQRNHFWPTDHLHVPGVQRLPVLLELPLISAKYRTRSLGSRSAR